MVSSRSAGSVGIIFPAGDPHTRDARLQRRCAQNFEQLAFAIEQYTAANGGHYPNTPDQLLLSGDAFPESFVCPSTGDTPAVGATRRDVADNFVSGRHYSYIYTGKGLTTATITRGQVIFYESARNHTRDHPGIHVLLGDGRVSYLEGDAANDLLARMKRGDHLSATPR